MNLPLIKRELALSPGSPPSAGLASSFERRRLRFYLVQILLDVAALAAAFLLTSPILGGSLGVPCGRRGSCSHRCS